MKKILSSLGIFCCVISYAQVGINTTTPTASAILDITSTNKGVLFPRVALQSLTDVTTVPSPAEGLMVWNTNTALAMGKGFYFFVDGAWTKIAKQVNTNIYDFVQFKQTSSNISMTSTLQELTQLSTTYTAPANGSLFLNYILYATMANNANVNLANTYAVAQITDTTTSVVQTGTILVSPGEVVANLGSNAVASPSAILVNVIKGHTYTIKLLAREAYLNTANYNIIVGTVSYSGNSANSSLLINSLLTP